MRKDVAQFLEKCTDSGQTYRLFKELLQGLQNDTRRQVAHQTLLGLRDAFYENNGEDFLANYHFSFNRIDLGEELAPLHLLQLPSIFSPEEWSYTFYEGLSRFPRSTFEDKNVVELGCGNGWITIALALRCQPRKIFGLDINPKAIMCAQVNLFQQYE